MKNNQLQGYVMEAAIEASRLEEQARQSNYSLEEELGKLHFSAGEVVMDAGCGTGLLSRYLVDRFSVGHIDALDYSELRLQQAKNLLNPEKHQGIQFHRQDLSKLDPQFHGKYDTVICRFVVQHVENASVVIRELVKALKPGGRLIITESDGVFVNLYSPHEVLNKYMDEFLQKIPFDLHVGRKVPSLMKTLGLNEIQWEATLLSCQGKALQEEIENTEKRFAAATEMLAKLFGQARSEEFRDLYLQEMKKTENTLVFTRFVCVGKNVKA